MNVRLQSLKIQNIPLCCSEKITNSECARRVGITARSVCRLKNRFKKYGAACFVHGNTGRVPKNKRFDDDKIVSFYNKKFACSPFAVYADMLVETHTLNVSYSHVYTALDRAGIMSPKAHVPIREKKKHLPRKERPNFIAFTFSSSANKKGRKGARCCTVRPAAIFYRRLSFFRFLIRRAFIFRLLQALL